MSTTPAPALNDSALPSPLPPSLLAPDNYAFRERAWRVPIVPAGETILIDEPGRVLDRKDAATAGGGVCCRSHCFRVTREIPGGRPVLRVKHGAGEESFPLSYDPRVIDGLRQMDSDSRFRLLWVIMDAHHTAARNAAERVNATWRKAAAEKRIKTRRLPRQNAVKVWIEDPAPVGQSADVLATA